MLYLRHVPLWPLSEFVEILWLYDGVQRPHEKERLLPDGSMELVINLRENVARIYDRENTDRYQSFPGTLLAGTQSEYFVIDTAEQLSVMGAHFKPGGAFQFFRLPADELHNAHVALDTLWAADAANLRDQLLEAQTPGEKFAVLEKALMEKAVKRFERHPAVGFALKKFQGTPHSATIGSVTGQIGLSSRRFIEVFRSEVGVTPKLFCRIRRFQRLIRLVGSEKQVDWADVALACGYFDQAHFIHDFRAFSGINPSTYLLRKTEHLNHVPLVE